MATDEEMSAWLESVAMRPMLEALLENVCKDKPNHALNYAVSWMRSTYGELAAEAQRADEPDGEWHTRDDVEATPEGLMEYLKVSKITAILEAICERAIRAQPANVVAFVIDELAALRSVRYTAAPSALPPRRYVLLVSGSMNPPHAGHVRLGLQAAARLRAEGHTIGAICFVPVHDNYLLNKLALKRLRAKGTLRLDHTVIFSMEERCALLREHIAREDAEQTKDCHVLDYECSSPALLTESPGYWAKMNLPDGYLKTVPTTTLVKHFAQHSPLFAAQPPGTRIGLVFGVDNLAGMAAWNAPERLCASADLILLAREMASVPMSPDPTQTLLRPLKYVEARIAVPVTYEERTLLGGESGSFVDEHCTEGDGALFLLPPLPGEDETLNSGDVRKAVAARVAAEGAEADGAGALVSTLTKHGFPEASIERVLSAASVGEEAVKAMWDAAVARGEKL